jgi:hypothetical protein
MNQKPVPYPPQMRNAVHLPSSPHFDPVANIVDDLKAIRQEVAAAGACQEAACVSDAIAHARQEDARRQQLLMEQAARARQEAAAACAQQEAARMSNAIARACQDDNDYDDNDNDNDDNDDDDNDDDKDYDNDDDNDNNDDDDNNNNEDYDDDEDDNNDNNNNNDNDAKDEYDNVAGRLKAYAETLFACIDATMAEIQAMDDGFENRAAAREKALADEVNEQ